MNLISELKNRLKECILPENMLSEEPLSKHTSFRIGGPAELMVFPRGRKELSDVFRISHEMGIRPYVLGAGTNVLVPDEGLRALVIVTKNTFLGLERMDETHISAMSGMSMAKTAMFAATNSLSGLEFAHGIPGTVGGGVYMNAGAYGGEIKNVAIKTEYMFADGSTRFFEGDAQAFSYRSSAFQKLDGMIIRTVFELLPGQEQEIRERISELAEKRRSSQPLEFPSAGSTFKRPVGGYAAALIEQAGLKGLSVGGAAVSEKHAGFVINKGGATANDVLTLIKLVQKRVYDHSGILLEPEVRLWGKENES